MVCQNPNCSSQGQAHPNCRCGPAQNYAQGGSVLGFCEGGQEHSPGCNYSKGGSVNIDLKKFKKVGQTKTHTIMEHPEGHTIHILHSSLSNEHKKDAKGLKMSQGGKIDYSAARKQQEEVYKRANPPPAPTPVPVTDPDNEKKFHEAAHFADGGMLGEMRQEAGVADPSQPFSTPASTEELPEQQIFSPEVASEVQPMPEMASNTEMVSSQREALDKGVGNKLAGVTGKAQEDQKVAQENAGSIGTAIKDLSKLSMQHQEISNKIQTERQAFNEDLQLHMKEDPDRYINKMPSGQKLLTAIGMGLSSIGSAITGQPNQVVTFINNQIQHDVEAQRNDKSNQFNLYKANLQYLGDQDAALKMTQAMTMDALALKAQQAAAKHPGIASQAQGFIGDLQMDSAAKWKELEDREIVRRAAGGGEEAAVQANLTQLRAINPGAAKDLESRYVPGVGVGSIAVPQEIRKDLTARNTLQKQLQELRQYAVEHEGSFDPAVIKKGHALALQVQDAYRTGNNQGVFKPAEAEFVRGVISDNPTAFFRKLRTDPSYEAALKTNESILNGMKQSYGLPTSEGASLSPEKQQAAAWLKANPNDPRAETVRKLLNK